MIKKWFEYVKGFLKFGFLRITSYYLIVGVILLILQYKFQFVHEHIEYLSRSLIVVYDISLFWCFGKYNRWLDDGKPGNDDNNNGGDNSGDGTNPGDFYK